jgi:hypothetical protein
MQNEEMVTKEVHEARKRRKYNFRSREGPNIGPLVPMMVVVVEPLW